MNNYFMKLFREESLGGFLKVLAVDSGDEYLKMLLNYAFFRFTIAFRVSSQIYVRFL